MQLIELNIFKKFLKKIFPEIKNLYLADDFARIEILFIDKNFFYKKKFFINLYIFFFKPTTNFFSLNKIKNKEQVKIIKELFKFFIYKKNFKLLFDVISKFSYNNKLRFYRLLLFFKKYREANILRFSKNYSKVFQSEDHSLSNLKKKVLNYGLKKIDSSIAIVGPLDDISKYKNELNTFDHLLIINPSNRYNFKDYPNADFAFYFRTPSIDAIQKNIFTPPLIKPIFVITEKRTLFFTRFNMHFNGRLNLTNHSEIIKDKSLIGKLNAVQSITLHLIQMGYKKIGIYGCDLFLTPRTNNKREDYAPYQENVHKLMRENDRYNHFMCHEPYLNFIVLKKLFETNMIIPYSPLKKILSSSYDQYIFNLEKVVN